MNRIIPKSNRRVVMMLLTVIFTAATAWSQESTTFSGGDGTIKNPYIIKTSSDWSQLATNVAAGISYSDQHFRLDDDITVTTMMGTGTNVSNAKSFSGTFDGNGHKLTVNYEGTDDIATAPFRFLSNATIMNLHVDGVITSSHKYVAGLAGRTYGTTLIQGCRISTIIRSSVNGDGTHGGIVALKPNSSSAKLTIEGCVFDGKILTTNGTTCCGGFVGYTSYGSLTIKNSIYAPAAPVDGETAVNDGCTFYRYPTKNSGTITLTNCYYTQTLGTDQGKQARNISFNEGVDIDIIPTGISTEYGVSGITGYEGNPCVKYNGTVYAGYNDEVNLTFNHHYVNCEVYYTIFKNENYYALNDNDHDGIYTVTVPNTNFTLLAQALPSGGVIVTENGSEEFPYLISDAASWDYFVSLVNKGEEKYATAYYRLTGDISVTTMMGTSEHPFKGHFDGGIYNADKNLVGFHQLWSGLRIGLLS